MRKRLLSWLVAVSVAAGSLALPMPAYAARQTPEMEAFSENDAGMESRAVSDADGFLAFDTIKGNNVDQEHINSNLQLPIEGEDGSKITWFTDTPSAILDNGVVIPDRSEAKTVTLTAVRQQNGQAEEQKFNLTVPADPNAREKEPMHILQIGDSNTDYGRITNGMYQILKEKDGDYGQGFLTINGFHFGPSGKLGDYSTVSVRMNYSGAWACYDLFNDEDHAKDSPFGISAVANSPDVFAEAEFTGSAADIYYECISGAGKMRVTVDGTEKRIIDLSEGGTAQGTARKAVFDGLGYGKHTIRLTTIDAKPVTIYGIDYRISDAVNRSSISRWGLAGIRAQQYAEVLDPQIFATALEELNPDKVVLLMGTNDNGANINAENLERHLDTVIKRVKDALPKAEIWVVGTFETVNDRMRLHEYWLSSFPNAANKNNVHYWNMGEWFGSYSNSQMADGWHSNDEYSKKIAEKMYDVIIGGTDVSGRNVAEIPEMNPVIAAVGTPFEKLRLPSSVQVVLMICKVAILI